MTVLLNLFEQKVLFFVIIADILAPIFRSCLDFIKNDYQIYYLKCNVVSNLKSCPSLRGTRTFSKEKVRRGFLTYRIAINRTTRRKPLRLQKTSFFESTSPSRAGAFLISFFADI